jgi:hypothetical protein
MSEATLPVQAAARRLSDDLAAVGLGLGAFLLALCRFSARTRSARFGVD